MKLIDQSEKVDLLPPPRKRRRLEPSESEDEIQNGSDMDDEAPAEVNPHLPDNNICVKPGEKARILKKQYLDLGVEWGLTGKSPGTPFSSNFITEIGHLP